MPQAQVQGRKWVYSFGKNKTDGRMSLSALLGAKGANLAEMCLIGLPVPPGFTITTEVCAYYYCNGKSFPSGLKAQVETALSTIEQEEGAHFGAPDNPLLVSVRSGAQASMPGMLDTVLNLGLNDKTVIGLAQKTRDARFAYDSYRRFIQMYGNVVLEIDHFLFEEVVERLKEEFGKNLDTEVSAEEWKAVIEAFKSLIEDQIGEQFPQDPHAQLWGAIGAVFGSWMNPRAQTFRQLHRIPEDWGTAVSVQAMVFGNKGGDCASGIASTRDPLTGENGIVGEFLINSQGEDVESGSRTAQYLSKRGKELNDNPLPSMEEAMPRLYAELLDIREKLERHFGDMQDIEFTVQQGRLYLLQTQAGKRSATAAIRMAVEMARDGLIDKAEAVLRIEPNSLEQLLHPAIDKSARRKILCKGAPASPGAVSGKIVFHADNAEKMVQAGEDVIFCSKETSPEDIHGMHAAKGILTTRGGMTSHAAVVARGMGRPCVAGASEIEIDAVAQTMTIRGTTLKAGDVLTIDGSSGEVIRGEVPTIEPELSEDFHTLMGWADELRRMGVRANAETPMDAQLARSYGAEGIGLCRTEHMFFEAGRSVVMREMILARDKTGRRAALSQLEPYQISDFVELFKIMKGRPVTIRLLDPPLHEFLPQNEVGIKEVSEATGLDVEVVRARVAYLSEANPMLGHRGCRLGISYPEIYEMQARAIFKAAIQVMKQTGETVTPEIMIPLVMIKPEIEQLKDLIQEQASQVFGEAGARLDYSVGTMIELPRAILVADRIAETAEFFSFGTNDLTQTTLGISRDDAGTFLPDYQRQGLLADDPFVTLDRRGVGALMRMGTERGRATRPDLKVGICGEHGGEPNSIAFCEDIGLDYVSCSPYRVPIARLAAAQSAIRNAMGQDLERIAHV